MVTNSFGNKNYVQPISRLKRALKGALIFFLLSFGWRGLGGGFFSFFLCSLYVPFKFPMCSLRVFQVAPRFNPICFVQSPPLLTYIGGPKLDKLPSFIDRSLKYI